jgi:hypothetical protein
VESVTGALEKLRATISSAIAARRKRAKSVRRAREENGVKKVA